MSSIVAGAVDKRSHALLLNDSLYSSDTGLAQGGLLPCSMLVRFNHCTLLEIHFLSLLEVCTLLIIHAHHWGVHSQVAPVGW